HRGACVVGSGNGLAAAERAHALLAEGTDPADAVVAGVTLVEDDPEDQSVGLGGLPNLDGVVQLDASVMHGPSCRAGAVAALEDVQNPAQVALLVLKRTDHVLLVGAGAKRFALEHGFRETELLTPKSRAAWLAWRAKLNRDDDHLDPDQQLHTEGELEIPYTTGTVHLSAVTAGGDLGSTTSTSGLSYKLPGRVGDSPLVGAGMYCDNEVGAAGATGRGEAVIESCGAFGVVRAMEQGATPTEACLAVLRRIAARTKRPHLLDAEGRPHFQVTLYALRKDGAYGSASLRPGATFAVHDGDRARQLPSVPLF
ncbi:MAG TPA: N(4)-(beta-N-acetylglucosaminyl)-L-asparaginase, partial [Planctomycetota bacterium]|nr:N(4)-(beta-N-acetylglucosaminyl)-L-asparaginase [Planctomycetota bacterium]